MEIIARFPALPTTPADAGLPEPAVAVEPKAAPCPAVVTAVPAVRRRRHGFPTWSVAALAFVAVVAWSLASWHEQTRLARQRRPDRLARHVPAATPPAETAAP